MSLPCLPDTAWAQSGQTIQSAVSIAPALPGANDDASISDIHLFGVIASNQVGRSQALVSLKNQTARLVRSGDSLGGWRVGEISLESVNFERNGITSKITLSNALGLAKTKPAQDIRSAIRTPTNYPGPIIAGTPGLD